MFSGYLSEDGEIVTDPHKLVNHWIKNGKQVIGLTENVTHAQSHRSMFTKDIICLIPFDLVFIWTGFGKPYHAVRFNRFLKYGRFSKFLNMSEARTSKPDLLRLSAVVRHTT